MRNPDVLSDCLVDSDADAAQRNKQRRRKALTISLAVEVVLLTALLSGRCSISAPCPPGTLSIQSRRFPAADVKRHTLPRRIRTVYATVVSSGWIPLSADRRATGRPRPVARMKPRLSAVVPEMATAQVRAAVSEYSMAPVKVQCPAAAGSETSGGDEADLCEYGSAGGDVGPARGAGLSNAGAANSRVGHGRTARDHRQGWQRNQSRSDQRASDASPRRGRCSPPVALPPNAAEQSAGRSADIRNGEIRAGVVRPGFRRK